MTTWFARDLYLTNLRMVREIFIENTKSQGNCITLEWEDESCRQVQIPEDVDPEDLMSEIRSYIREDKRMFDFNFSIEMLRRTNANRSS